MKSLHRYVVAGIAALCISAPVIAGQTFARDGGTKEEACWKADKEANRYARGKPSRCYSACRQDQCTTSPNGFSCKATGHDHKGSCDGSTTSALDPKDWNARFPQPGVVVSPPKAATAAGVKDVGYSPVYVECFPYAANPGNLKGEFRLQNQTAKEITAVVARGTSQGTSYTVAAGKYIAVGYMFLEDLPCNNNFQVISWK